jgi:hypothetical protein
MTTRLALAAGLLVATLLAACSGGGAEEIRVEQLVCESLLGVDSYHYESHAAVEVVAPAATPAETPAGSKVDPPPFVISWDSSVDVKAGGDQLQARIESNDSGRKTVLDMIKISGDVWQQADPNVGYARLIGTSEPTLPYPPEQTCDALQQNLDLQAMTPTYEEVDGVDTAKFTLEDMPSAYLSRASGFGAGDAVTVVESYDGAIWVTEEGHIFRLELSGSGQYPGGSTLRVENSYGYSDINDVDVEIVAPSR